MEGVPASSSSACDLLSAFVDDLSAAFSEEPDSCPELRFNSELTVTQVLA